MAKKTPQRMCVACREMRDKRDLLRLVRSPEGTINLDLSGKKSGRGAYLCAEEACLHKARKIRAVERVLQSHTEDDLWQELMNEINRRQPS